MTLPASGRVEPSPQRTRHSKTLGGGEEVPGAGLQQPEGQWQPKEPQAPVLLQCKEQPQSRNLLSSSCPVFPSGRCSQGFPLWGELLEEMPKPVTSAEAFSYKTTRNH